MSSQTKKQYTYADYAKLPEGAPYQLIAGELVMTPAPTPYHQRISRRLVVLLSSFVEERDLGEVLAAPVDVYLADMETYQPDIVFIAKERLDIIGEARIEGAPDLVIEILSPSTGYYDLTHKKRIYETSGVQEYWLVDPQEKTVEVYANDAEFTPLDKARRTGRVHSRLLAGFSVGLEEIF